MLELRQKVSPREVVVGWFSTGDEINATSAVIHAFYCKKDEKGRVRLNMTILPRHTETYRDNIIIMSRGGFGLLSGTWRHFTEIFALLWELFFFSQYLISHISYLISHPSLSLSLSFSDFLDAFESSRRHLFLRCHQRSHLSSIPQQFCRALSTFSLTHLWCSSRGLGSPNGAIFVAINAVFFCQLGKTRKVLKARFLSIVISV